VRPIFCAARRTGSQPPVQAEHCIVAILLPAMRIRGMLASEFRLRWGRAWGGRLLSMRSAGGGQHAGGNQK
jgi:hypothetical protein